MGGLASISSNDTPGFPNLDRSLAGIGGITASGRSFRDRKTLALRQLPQALAHSPCAPIFLTPLPANQDLNYPGGLALPDYATVRLRLTEERWLYRRDDVRGYKARVQVSKTSWVPPIRAPELRSPSMG